ncbi:MAG: heliorhodopsin HeR [Candidatus Dojkabacteria bacterium]
MGFFHLIQAVIMLAISNDFAITLTTNFFKSSGSPADGTFVIGNQQEALIDVRVGAAVALFLLMSAIAHFLLASPGIYEWYVKNLKEKKNYARWYEYAFSSSVMIVIIGLLVGFNDAPGLVLLFALNAFMNIFGLLMEKYNTDHDNVDWTNYIYGVIAGIIPWIIIAWYFVSAVQGYDPGENGNPIPDFVYLILISIFIFFNIFAVNMFLQYKKIGPWKNYLFGEAMYIVLSLVAKSALAWQVFSGTLRGD